MVFTPQQATGKKLGAYELLREVCASSVGATSIARNASSEAAPQVSLTKVHRHVAKSPQLCDNFLQAAKKAAVLDHSNVERLVDSGTVDGELFVAYEHHDGDTLASLLRRAGPEGLTLPVASRIVLDMLEGVRAAHGQGAELGHGELGPWCVHLGEDGRARISGFAVDRALTRFGLHYAKNLDRLPYAAPERVKAMSLTLGPPPPAPDLRADTFSVGVIAWELFTRQRLFASRMEAAVIQKVLASAIPDPKSQRAELHDDVARALQGLLVRDPAERASIDDLVRALEATDVASHDAVSEFASRQVDRSQTRAISGAPRAFSSVRPPPMAPAVAAPMRPRPANGVPVSAPPAPQAGAPRTRAKTLMGVDGTSTQQQKHGSFVEEEVTVNMQAGPGVPLAAPPKVPVIEDESTSVDSDLLVEAEETPPPGPTPGLPPGPPPGPPPAPHGRRPPPKPRQQTLLGVEPVAQPAPPPAPTGATALKPGASTLMGIPKLDVEAAIAERQAAQAPTQQRGGAADRSARPAASSGQSAVDKLAPGATLGKPPHAYQLLSVVARGGMATVWAARPDGAVGIDKLVAVKTLLPELSDDADFETMFVDEMRVAARIKHPNVAEILTVGEEGGVMFIALEWVDGETFGAVQEAAQPGGGVPLPILVRMASDVCAGLHAAHELRDEAGNLLDLVHRDINPSNVLIGRDGTAKVVDFGIAKSKGRVHVTRAGSTVKGKTPYLSPEQLGGLALDRRVDLFSLGALLYLMATGVHPFRGDTELRTIENIVTKSPAPLRTVVADIHPDFDALVLRLLEKDPRKRPATAEEVRGELERIAKMLERPASARDVGAFVERVVSDTLQKRHADLLGAAKKLAPAGAIINDVSPIGASPAPGFAALDEPTLADDGMAGTVPAFDAPLSTSTSGDVPLDEDVPLEEEPRRFSPWVRLVLLIVIGVAVGIGVIAMIEALRSPSDPAKTATPTVQPTSTVTALVPPPPATMTIEVKPTSEPEPPPTATETATAAASETATPEPPPTQDPVATGKPPATGRPPRPPFTGTRPPPPPPRPPTTGKKPPPKYNPSGI